MQTFSKTMKKRLRHFNYLLISNNRLSDKFFSLLLMLELYLVLQLPLDQLLNFPELNPQGSFDFKYNVVLGLGKLSSFLIVTDFMNGLLALCTALILGGGLVITHSKGGGGGGEGKGGKST